MSTPYLGEIKVVSFNFPPKGWALCNGQLLPINQNQALFSLLGTTYGGNGQNNFALPDFRGRAPVHFDNGTTLGQLAGEENHKLTVQEMPAHGHFKASASQATQTSPVGNVLAAKPRFGVSIYGPPPPRTPVLSSDKGSSASHTNMQPYLTLNFIIALTGIFPSRN
jgi:microcystin-dependent protein